MHTAERKTARHVEVVVLSSPVLEATFVPVAGMVGCSVRHGGEELLVQRGGLDAWRGTGKSFGLPLLHPWANRLPDWRYAVAGRVVGLDRYRGAVRPDEHGLPIHGAMAAAEDWEITACEGGGGEAHLGADLDYGRRDDRLAAFPFPHRLTLDVRLRESTLSVTTTVVPTADLSVPLAFGWHPWLGLPGVPRAEWVVTMPARKQLLLDERNLPTGEVVGCEAEQAPLADRVLDDHFETGTRARFAVAGGGREIAVSWDAGYTHAQVFAPRILDVVCLEPMMAPVAALSSGEGLRFAAPGTSASATFDISVT